MRVTLDSNAIIDLEEGRAGAPALRERAGAVEPDYSNFMAKLIDTDLADVELLNPPCHWGITF